MRLVQSEPRRGKKRGQGGDGEGLAESCGLPEDLKFCSHEVGGLEGWGLGEGQGLTQCSRPPSGGTRGISVCHHPKPRMKQQTRKGQVTCPESHRLRSSGARNLRRSKHRATWSPQLPAPSPRPLYMPLFDFLGLRLCGSFSVSISLSLPLVSAPGRSGAPVGWYLDADENRLAHGQQPGPCRRPDRGLMGVRERKKLGETLPLLQPCPSPIPPSPATLPAPYAVEPGV